MGVGAVAVREYDDPTHGWVQDAVDEFTPSFFSPPLVLIDIPSSCPTSATQHLLESSTLYFADPGAAINCARSAVEAVLTDLGVRRYIIQKGKRRRPLDLHSRIEKLPAKYEALKKPLIAVKWLGNAGSHDGDPPGATQLRETYDLLEHALNEIYAPKARHLAALAKKVIKRKGRVSAVKRR